MKDDQTFTLSQSLAQTYQDIKIFLLEHAPEILGAITLLLVGWLVARLAQIAVRRLIGSFDSVFNRVFKVEGTREARIRNSYAGIISRLIFWAVIIFFVAAASNLFGWALFGNWMQQIAAYLPDLVTGLLIILVGLLIAGALRPLSTQAAESMGVERSELIGQLTQLIVIFTSTVIGVEQAGIDVHFLTTLLIVILGVLLAGGALAFGLGARSLVANIIGAQYSRKHLQRGESVQLGDIEGTVLEISQTAIVLETARGKAIIPAQVFNEEISQVADPSADQSESQINPVERQDDGKQGT